MAQVIYTGIAEAAVPGLPAFQPWEARTVNDAWAVALLANRHFGGGSEGRPAAEAAVAAEAARPGSRVGQE